jgi:cobalamin biosynthetic protein CobC
MCGPSADLDIGEPRSVVLVNPNNPDGRVVSTERLIELAVQCAARGGLLVVDEAFADFTPEISMVPALPPATLVLRSFGKTYGLAGLRLGFAIGDRRDLTERPARGDGALGGGGAGAACRGEGAGR